MLGAAVLGHAGDRLITSFDAKPGDRLVIAIDMHGVYQGDKPFWNASTSTPPERLRTELEDLPCPMDVEMEKWLVSFPSYGYLLVVAPEDIESTQSHFTATRITCREIRHFQKSPGITLTADGESVELVFSKPGVPTSSAFAG
jgi:uncharacterized protein